MIAMLAAVVLGVAPGATSSADEHRPGCGAGQFPIVAGPDGCFDWQEGWRLAEVTVPSRLSSVEAYEGRMLAPLEPGVRPVIVVQHGYQGSAANGHWALRHLAASGYVVLAVTAPSSGESGTAEGFVAAVQSALDFLETDANPFLAESDLSTVGAAGHSLGARAVSYAQQVDERIDAIVAWDNLPSDLHGDDGTAIDCSRTGTGVPMRLEERVEPIVPRVPAMGQAQELPCVKAPDQLDRRAKLTGFDVWRAAGLPSVVVSVAGTDHFEWSQWSGDTVDNATEGEEAKSERYRYLARLTERWFDAWLLDDPSGLDDVLALIGPEHRSTRWASGVHLPGRLDCPDLDAC